MPNQIVPYNFKYHAEIMYETLDGFNFCNANGNSDTNASGGTVSVLIEYYGFEW